MSTIPSIQTTVVLDLEAALRFLKSNLADEKYTVKDAYKADMNNKSYRVLLTEYLVNAIPASDQRSLLISQDDVLGLHVALDVSYHNGELGAELIKAGVITGCRVYGTELCPFGRLPGKLNDLVLSKFYANLDDAKAQARAMLVLANKYHSPKAADVLETYLQDPEATLADVAGHYKVETVDAKLLFTALGMDGSIASWRAKHKTIPKDIADHTFAVDYGKGVKDLTFRLGELFKNNMEVVNMIVRHRQTTGKAPADNWRVTLKSYMVQEVEFQSLQLKMEACPNGFGPLEHDGIRVYTAPQFPDGGTMVVPPKLRDLETRMTSVVSTGLGVTVPVVHKPAREFKYERWYNENDFAVDHFETRMCVPFQLLAPSRLVKTLTDCIQEPEEKLARTEDKDEISAISAELAGVKKQLKKEQNRRKKVYEWLYLRILNHYFINMTFQKQPGVVQLAYNAGTDRICEHILSTAAEVEAKFRMRHEGSKLMSWWLNHYERRERQKLGFYPNEELAAGHPRDFNTFVGLPYDCLTRPATLDFDLLEPFLTFWFDVLAIGSAEHFEYQLKWIAYVVQLRKKTGTVLHLYGDQGVGKDMLLGDWGMMGKIMGQSFRKISQTSRIMPKFNAEMLGALYVVLDEVDASKNWQAPTFKDFVSAEIMTIELKNFDPIRVGDFRSFGSTSNNNNAYQVDPGDRRFYMLEVKDTYAMRHVKEGTITADQRQRQLSHIVGARYGPDETVRNATRGARGQRSSRWRSSCTGFCSTWTCGALYPAPISPGAPTVTSASRRTNWSRWIPWRSTWRTSSARQSSIPRPTQRTFSRHFKSGALNETSITASTPSVLPSRSKNTPA